MTSFKIVPFHLFNDSLRVFKKTERFNFLKSLFTRGAIRRQWDEMSPRMCRGTKVDLR